VREEGALAELLPADGLLAVPGDSPFAGALAARTRARVVRTGFGPANDWRVRVEAAGWAGQRLAVTAPVPGWSGTWELPLPGRHSALNALTALMLAAELGADPAAARGGLASFTPPQRRLNLRQAGGVRLIDDTYNANADSMLAALQTLIDLPCAGRRVAVLGDMAELGRHTGTAHAEVGRFAAATADVLFAVGRHAPLTREAAAAAGARQAEAFAEIPAALSALCGLVRPGDVVLVKASRSSRLERLLAGLERHLNRPGGN
jgi:UDP-N-acetylmuramoyl-tripeptide--D-alanyl-D-alanine ligase